MKKTKQNLRILVVDDSKVMRDMLTQQLTEFEYEPRAVNNGDEALEALQHDHFDVVITDLVMPGKVDGLKLLEIIKQEVENIAVVLMTGHASMDTALEAMKKGAVKYFSKPFKLEKMLNLLEKIAKDKKKGGCCSLQAV